MSREAAVFSWGKLLFIYFIFSFILVSSATNIIAKESLSEGKFLPSADNVKTQGTIITLQTSGPVIYKSHFFSNPPRFVLSFAPKNLSSQLKEQIAVNSGMVKKIQCCYYNSPDSMRWLKSITFFLLAKTGYEVREDENQISILVHNTPEASINSTSTDEVVIKDYLPAGFGSAERAKAIKTAIKFLIIKRQMTRRLVNEAEPSVLVEKKSDNSIRITAANLTPVDMITTGTKVLLADTADTYTESLNQPIIQRPAASQTAHAGSTPAGAAGKDFDMTPSDLAKASLGFLSIMLGVLIVDRIRVRKINIKKAQIQAKPESKDTFKVIEEFFLKDEELQKWPTYNKMQQQPDSAIATEQISKDILGLPSITADIAERRRFPRADIKNARGILNRAVIGSKTQPFKNIRVNNISKNGLCFLVRSKDIKFRMPTIVKLYFSSSSKPVDLWVRIIWEKEDSQSEGKNVGVKFTRVPRETWEKVMEAFGHRLG